MLYVYMEYPQLLLNHRSIRSPQSRSSGLREDLRKEILSAVSSRRTPWFARRIMGFCQSQSEPEVLSVESSHHPRFIHFTHHWDHIIGLIGNFIGNLIGNTKHILESIWFFVGNFHIIGTMKWGCFFVNGGWDKKSNCFCN